MYCASEAVHLHANFLLPRCVGSLAVLRELAVLFRRELPNGLDHQDREFEQRLLH